MPSAKNFYDVLGVSKNASDKDIKSAFRKLAQKYHPDRGGDEAKFKEISEAYDTLSNPEKRKEYDMMLQFGGIPGAGGGYGYAGGAGGPSMADIFGSMFRGEGVSGAYGADPTTFDFGDMFGGGRARARKGSDLKATIDVTFDEALRGAKRNVTHRIPSTGETDSIEVTIPAGCYDGMKVRFKNHGEYGVNGGPRGNMLIEFRVAEHPVFKRRGKTGDVALDVPISMYEAALGCTVDVPTPAGKTLRLKVPAGTQSGKSFRFKEMGMPDAKRPGHTGALLASVTVQVPTSLTDKERAALEKLVEADERQYRSRL
ncbi:MAG: J domain-containing protein [Coriobacteriaceae bacterium]|nr:J domain-containing protein [Coriobacteriaceae bacterium]